MDDRVRLIHGDAAERLAEMPAGSVDLVLTSPPYDNLRRYSAGHAFDFEATAAGIVRALKPGGVCVWVVGDETKNGSESGTSFRQALHFKALGLNLHDTMIFGKSNPLPQTHRRYEQVFEFAFVLSKGRPAKFNPLTERCKMAGKPVRTGAKYHPDQADGWHGKAATYGETKLRGNIWFYPLGTGKNGHPAVFPLQLAVDHILSWTNPDDLVVDPFVGSGTVLEACLKTGRRGVGIDISADYLDIARRRISAALAA